MRGSWEEMRGHKAAGGMCGHGGWRRDLGHKELLRQLDGLVAEELGVLDDKVLVLRNQAEGFPIGVEV